MATHVQVVQSNNEAACSRVIKAMATTVASRVKCHS